MIIRLKKKEKLRVERHSRVTCEGEHELSKIQ